MSVSRLEKQGFWWLPNEPERQLPGTLVFGHDVDAELRLLGSMQEDFDALRAMGRGGAEFRPEIILGTTSDGKDYTLVNCPRSDLSMSAHVIESYLPTIVIEGRHFMSKADMVFHDATFRLSHLSEWYQRTGRKISCDVTDNEWKS